MHDASTIKFVLSCMSVSYRQCFFISQEGIEIRIERMLFVVLSVEAPPTSAAACPPGSRRRQRTTVGVVPAKGITHTDALLL